jgi:hypothetical protein
MKNENSLTPIFIGGADRSGTTMLASLLQCIPESCVTPESLFKSQVKWQNDIVQYSEELKDNRKFNVWKIRPDNITESTEARFLLALVREYGGDVKYWIDHTPNNLQEILRLSDMFPDARFIHIVRDGRAVTNSIMPLEWGMNTAMASAKDWTEKLAYAFAAQSQFPSKCMMVKYEDVVEMPVQCINNILKFLDINKTIKSTDDLILSDDYVPAHTKKMHASVGKIPDKRFINKWKTELTKDQIRDFEYYGSTMLEMLGYELQRLGRPSKSRLIKQIICELFYKKIVNRYRYKKRNAY